MRRSYWLWLFLVALISPWKNAEASDLFGTIYLRGRPLANAEIELTSSATTLNATANEHGYYSLRNLTPGDYTLVIHLPDGGKRSEPVYVFPQNTEKDIELE